MQLSQEQEDYLRHLALANAFRKANPEAAAAARYEAALRYGRQTRTGEDWRKHNREYARAYRARARQAAGKAPAPECANVTLAHKGRKILVSVFPDGEWSIARNQTGYGPTLPQKQTARAWIRNGYHGDLSEEPEFVRTTFAAIKTAS